MDSWTLTTIVNKCFPFLNKVRIVPCDVYLQEYHVYMTQCNSKSDNKPIMYIVNSGDSDTAGNHWVVVVLRHKCKGRHLFFDSLGHTPSHYRLGKNDIYNYINISVQPNTRSSDLCWAYCIFYLCKFSSGDINNVYNTGFNTKCLLENDRSIISKLKFYISHAE